MSDMKDPPLQASKEQDTPIKINDLLYEKPLKYLSP